MGDEMLFLHHPVLGWTEAERADERIYSETSTTTEIETLGEASPA